MASPSRSLPVKLRGSKLFLSLLLLLVSSYGAKRVEAQCVVGHLGAKWCPSSGGQAQIPYYLGEGIADCLLSPGCIATRAAILTAVEDWNNIADSDLDYAFHIYFAGNLAPGETPDYGIVFTYGAVDQGLFVCSSLFNPPHYTSFCDVPVTGQVDETYGITQIHTVYVSPNTLRTIVSACIDINDQLRYGDVVHPGVDRASVVRHELGHALGLDHSLCGNDLMGTTIDCDTVKNIDPDAIVTAQCLYGASGPCATSRAGFDWRVVTLSGAVLIQGGLCSCISGCASATQSAVASIGTAAPTKIFEFALSDSGSQYDVFAIIAQDQFVGNEYRHFFPRSYNFARLRVRVFEDGMQTQEQFSRTLMGIPQGLLCPPGNRRPRFSSPVLADSTITVMAGQQLSFVVSATDSDASDLDTLSVWGLPLGAVMSSPLPRIGNPVSSTFTWAPTEADLGSQTLIFSASDGCWPAYYPITIKVVAPTFVVSPGDAFLSAGPAGGPFTPNCKTYVLRNLGPSSTTWHGTCDAAWITMSQSTGSIGPQDSASVEVCLNAQASQLAVGQYTASCEFVNETLGISQTRSVNLTVTEPCPDADHDGWTTCAGDCNDSDPNVSPGATEICNGIDDNCNGLIDDGGTPCRDQCPPPPAGVTFLAYRDETNPTAETDWRAAAGTTHLEDFESYPVGMQIPSLPLLGVAWAELAHGGFPVIYYHDEADTPYGQHHLGNFPHGINEINRWDDMVMLTLPGQQITAVGFYNGDGQEDTMYAVAYDAAGNVLGCVGAFKGHFAGMISSTPIAKVVFGGRTGDGWNHIDGLQTNAGPIVLNRAPKLTVSLPCGSTTEVEVGHVLTFQASVFDSDATDADTLKAYNLPAAMQASPALPLVGNPVSSTFTWTPTAADIGSHELRIEGKDVQHTVSCTFTVSVKGTTANQPPDCSQAVAVINQSKPPNGKLAQFWIQGITDPESDPVTIHITGITQDENVNASGDHNTCPDGTIIADENGSGAVRMERSGQGNGRVYEITFRAEDDKGGSCDGKTQICIPHDQGGSSCVDDGQTYNSLATCLAHEGITLNVAQQGPQSQMITYYLPDKSNISLKVYDVAGRHLATLEEAYKGSGSWEVPWQTGTLSNGIYFVQLQTDLGSTSTRVLVIK